MREVSGPFPEGPNDNIIGEPHTPTSGARTVEFTATELLQILVDHASRGDSPYRGRGMLQVSAQPGKLLVRVTYWRSE